MYVIFPADEVVYLSYGRLIYVPSSQPGQVNRTADRSNPNTSQVAGSSSSYPSATSASTSSTRSHPSTGPSLNGYSEGLEEIKQYLKGEDKSAKEKNPPVRPKRSKKGKEKTALSVDSPQVRNSPGRKEAKKVPERRLSFSDFLQVNRDKSVSREKSPRFLNCGEKSENREATPLRGGSPNVHSKEIGLDSRSQLTSRQQQTPEKSSPTKKKNLFVRIKRTEPAARMAGVESALRELTHPCYNEPLKAHNGVSFKLVRTVSDFTQQLGQLYEQHAEEIQLLVSNFRKKNGELRKERPACPSSLFHTWETLLQEVEIDSQALSDIASILGRQVSRPLLEKSFYRKIQSRKVFTHRDSYDTIIAKTEEKLSKCRQEYKTAYLAYLSGPTTDTLSAYFNTHNAYVQQLHATNGMLDEYNKETLPQLLQELEDIYSDLCSTLTDAVLQGAEVVSARAMEQYKRYDGLINQCRAVTGPSDLAHLARSLPPPQGRAPIVKRPFVPPQPPPPPEPVEGVEIQDVQNENIPPPLKDELVIDRLSALQVRPSHDALRKEAGDLEAQIRQIQDALDTLLRIQQRSLEAALFNKANELQEDISMKRFDLRVAQIHLKAINSQKELFSNKLESADTGRERKMSSSSTGSMKNKWLKAFKSLKTPPPVASPKESEKKNGGTSAAMAARDLPRGDPDAHTFQEYTYKKITPCDICSQILRGHTRQGLKCRLCKMNVHVDCQDKAPKCQPKSRLLRRQKSTSEIETRVPEVTEEEKSTEVDQIYQVLKQAGEISNKPRVNVEPSPPIGITVDRGAPVSTPGSSGSSGQSLNRRGVQPTHPQRIPGSNLTVNNPAPCSTSSDRRFGPSNTESSMRRRLFAGMKSLTGFGSRSRQGSPSHRSISLPERTSMRTSTSAVTFTPDIGYNNIAPHSPRRQKLNLRMKSLSLDSPESTEHVQRRRHHGTAATSEPHSNQSSSSRIQSPSSPVHNRRLLSAKNMRMSSVELPDDNDKSPSSASASPCPSPVGGKKSHRLLPTNLYVVLYNFKSRHQDELDLKAGDKVTVIDVSDPDWWKGKCLGKVGYFPSKYCSKLAAGEKPLQVTHNLQLSDGDNGLMLLRDQIVIQIGEDLDGMVMIRSGDNRQGICPLKFLQEV